MPEQPSETIAGVADPGSTHDIAFLGFGEAAQAILSGLRQDRPGLRALAYDIKTDDPVTAAGKRADYAAHDVAEATRAGALAGTDLIFSVVTADQAGAAAAALGEAAPGAPDLGGALFLDCNSCAPGTKRANAAVVEAMGGRYVDCAVMAAIHPGLHKTPCLLSGPHTADAAARMEDLGMNVTLAEGPVGTASTRKMIRSVMMKGLEALMLECLVAARKAGVEAEILASLEGTYPGLGWEKHATYNFERVTTHGRRRAAEMREVARTMADLGLPNHMSAAIAEWQERIGALGLPPGEAALRPRADAILAALGLGRDETGAGQ